MLQGDVYSDLRDERCLPLRSELKAHMALLVKLLYSGSSGYEFGTGEEEEGAQALRRRGMLHVSSSGRVTFLTPLHEAFHLVWLYRQAEMYSAAYGSGKVIKVAHSPAQLARFLESSVTRMRARELQQRTGSGSDGRVNAHHCQVGHGGD